MSTITLTPMQLNEGKCSFLIDPPVELGDVGQFSSQSASPPTIAASLLAVPGILEVEVRSSAFTVTKDRDVAWSDLDEAIRYAVEATLTGGFSAPADGGDLDDDAMFELVAEIFERDINPSVAQHGGRVDLIDVQDSTVVLRMQGGCQGCGMASVTLRQGIEGSLRRSVPGLKGIQDVTDHDAGKNPYFASQDR